MKQIVSSIIVLLTVVTCVAQDWSGIPVPADPGTGKVWKLRNDVSDDFSYDFQGTGSEAVIGGKWTNAYHNSWTGPKPTIWTRDHVYVEGGKMKIKASRVPGEMVEVNYNGSTYNLKATRTGCATSVKQVVYPVYVETYVKITKSVLASDVWMLSSDDTQEIDICEAYGGDRWTNEWFSNKRLHLSHHVFIRSPFQDWQPSDEGSFYTDGSTIWSDGYHRIGVYWKDPWHLEYYVDGKLVRTRSGEAEIDPKGYTNGTGLSKPMDIIINTEDQTWRAVQGLTPTDEELKNTDNTTFQVDWVRVYVPVDANAVPVTGVSLNEKQLQLNSGESLTLTATVLPADAGNKDVSWSSSNAGVATVDANGKVTGVSAGVANIVVLTSDGGFTDTCRVTVVGDAVQPYIVLDDETKYKTTNYQTGGELRVSCDFHAGTGNTVNEGVKFWLREIKPGWVVANDYVAYDYSAAGKESGTASAAISLENVPATAEIPADNWYFLFISFTNSAGENVNTGVYPIQIVRSTSAIEVGDREPFRIYPNPVADQLNVLLPNNETYSLSLIGMDGKIWVQEFPSEKHYIVQVKQLPVGLYFLRLCNKNGKSEVKKVVKQ